MDPYVNICICITPGADISDDRIAKDLAVAESIWHPITFQIQEVIVLNELFRFFDREISYKNSIQSQEKLASFFQTCVNEAPECDLYICYIGSDYFKETAVIACAYSLAKQQQLTGYIVLTNSAAPMKNIYARSRNRSYFIYKTCSRKTYSCRSSFSNRLRAPPFSNKSYVSDSPSSRKRSYSFLINSRTKSALFTKLFIAKKKQ